MQFERHVLFEQQLSAVVVDKYAALPPPNRLPRAHVEEAQPISSVQAVKRLLHAPAPLGGKLPPPCFGARPPPGSL
jgi:hypothetical protein